MAYFNLPEPTQEIIDDDEGLRQFIDDLLTQTNEGKMSQSLKDVLHESDLDNFSFASIWGIVDTQRAFHQMEIGDVLPHSLMKIKTNYDILRVPAGDASFQSRKEFQRVETGWKRVK